MKNTKIICTIGPASEKKEVLTELVKAGMNVIRLNFSHGDYDEQGARVKTIREINKEIGSNVAILLDTKGPEIRTHLFKDGKITLSKGQTVRVSMEEVEGTEERFSITYNGLINDVVEGNTILIDDGLIGLTVKGKEGNDIICEVQNTGTIKNRRGVNVPYVSLNMDFVSPKDRADMEYACDMDMDFIAASFVRRASDVLEIREILKNKGNSHIQIISKIENQEGVDNLDAIIEVSDGIMVARGDLGVEVPAEEVPIIQKTIIEKCNAAGKIVVTATQMLDSMQRNPRPTRAEVSDVANAVLDGTDAIMLSGESAAGDYPIEAVQTMARIARRTEEVLDYETAIARALSTSQGTQVGAIGLAIADTVLDCGAKAVVATTVSGATARAISRFRPNCPIIAPTPNEKTVRALALNWGVHPVLVEEATTSDEIIETSVAAAKQFGDFQTGETIVITGGLPIGEGNTNFFKIHNM